MKMKRMAKRGLALLMSLLLAAGGTAAFAEGTGQETGSSGTGTENTGSVLNTTTYEEYLAGIENGKNASKTFKVEGESKIGSDEDTKLSQDGKAVDVAVDGYAEWELSVPESGFYEVYIHYKMLEYHGNHAEFTVFVDGKTPYSELSFLKMNRIWKDSVENQTFEKDVQGNDLKPQQEEVVSWREMSLRDNMGYYTQPLKVYLTQGTHTLKIQMEKETTSIDWIEFRPPTTLKTYAEKKAEYEANGYKEATAEPIRIEAEYPYEKSDYTIYPIYDRSSPSVSPQSSSAILRNTLGADKWQIPGQWVTWKFKATQSGLYKIALKYRQNIQSGLFSSRSLTINGEAPFAEAETLQFAFNDKWQLTALGGDEPYEFYFEEGEEYEIRLQVTLGDMAEIVQTLQNSLLTLNEIYRSILMITGTDPDLNRDYNFKSLIPDTLTEMASQIDVLNAMVDRIVDVVGKKGEQVAAISRIIIQLETMTEKPDKIPANFKQFKDNIGAMGTTLQSMRNQPLELDYLVIAPASAKLEKADSGFFSNLWFQIKLLFTSYFQDYQLSSSSGMTSDEMQEKGALTVWIATGRDQAQIVRSMIDDDFSKAGDKLVDLQLVAAGSLLPATLAGIGPDVSLSNAIGDPINYAIRNAVVDLNEFNENGELDEVIKRFHSSAMVPYTYMGGVYALPETQSFPMMFYRKDIFEELGLKVPETWDDFYAIMPELKKNNMDIGFPIGINGLLLFMSQENESLYRDNGYYTNLDSDISLASFKKLTELFTLYKLPIQYDFPNRFRTGEMPLGIADYTTYNQLTVFAPEIKGLWEFVPVPGTRNEDGTINRNVNSTGTSVMMMSKTQNKELAWDFMKWWTSADTQKRFAVEMESVIGPAAKQPIANMEAFEGLAWSSTEFRNIMKQWESVVGIPEVPGGYYSQRYVDFAFNKVYNDALNPTDTMLDYIKTINNELLRKQKEFGIR